MNTNFVRKDMSGAVFVNDKKTGENDPDRTGSCTIGGTEYRISGWLRKDAQGRPYLGLSFRLKDARPAAPNSTDTIDW